MMQEESKVPAGENSAEPSSSGQVAVELADSATERTASLPETSEASQKQVEELESTGQSGAEEAQDEAMKLINDLQDINFLHIVAIIFAAWLLIFLTRKLLPLLAERGPSQTRLYILNAVPIIRLLTMTGAILWLIPIIFNVNFENFLVIAGGASVAIGFAFKDYVSGLIAGIIAVFERPYRPGDWVTIGDHYGEVRSVGMRSLCLQTAADDLVTVPHTRIWDENIANSNNGERTLMCVANFYIRPDHEADAVRHALREVAMTSAYLEYSKPVLVMLADEPWGTHYKVKAYPFDLRDQFAFISDLTCRGKSAVRNIGVEFVTADYATTSEQP